MKARRIQVLRLKQELSKFDGGILVLMLLLCSSFNLIMAQCPNDSCTTAYVLPPITEPDCAHGISKVAVNKTFFLGQCSPTKTTNLPPCQNYSNQKDLWFALKLIGNVSLVQIDINDLSVPTPGIPQLNYAIYRGNCNGLILEACGNNSNLPIVLSTKPDARYLMRVWDAAGQHLNFTINEITALNCCFNDCRNPFDFLQAPLGPDCSSFAPPQSITMSIPFTMLKSLPCKTTSSVPTPPDTEPCNFSGSEKDIWLRYIVPPNTGGVAIELAGISGCTGFMCSTDLNYALYRGDDCNNLTYVTCGQANDGFYFGGTRGMIIAPGRPGDKLWLRIFEEDDQGLKFHVTRITGLVEGDDCNLPAPITAGGCNVGAYPDNFVPPGLAGDACCWAKSDNTIFYSFIVSPFTPQPVTITAYNSVCESENAQIQMAIYAANCNELGGIGSNFYGCMCGNGTATLTANRPLPPGNYVVAVDGDANVGCRWDFAGNVVANAAFTRFVGELKDNRIRLEWQTFGTSPNLGFEIQRSFNRVDWQRIAYLPVQQSSSQLINYEYEDYDLRGEKQYYRLKIANTDGSFIYTNIVETHLADALAKSFAYCFFYPNPVTEGNTMLRFNLRKASNTRLRVVDALGRIVYDEARSLSGGFHLWELPISNLPTGYYYCSIDNGTDNAGVKLLVK